VVKQVGKETFRVEVMVFKIRIGAEPAHVDRYKERFWRIARYSGNASGDRPPRNPMIVVLRWRFVEVRTVRAENRSAKNEC
jgi:hypothetical protein